MSRNGCKVDAAIEDYSLEPPGSDLESLDDYLLARWTGSEGYRSVGYRKLADWFNRQLLRRVYDEHGRSTTGPTVDSEYEALTGDDELVKEEVVTELEAAGIDAEALVDDMVSPRTMHRHLTRCLEAEKERETAQTDWERESVEIARSQLEQKVAKAASSLASKGELIGAEAADIDIGIYLACPECATRVPFETGRRQGFVCERHSPASVDVELAGTGSVTTDRTSLDPQIDTVIEAITRFSM